MNPLSQTPGSPSAQIIELLQSHMPAVDSNGCVVDRCLLCKHPHTCLVIDPEHGDLCCTACSLVLCVRLACALGYPLKLLMPRLQAKKYSDAVHS